jgi:hypothetical protein
LMSPLMLLLFKFSSSGRGKSNSHERKKHTSTKGSREGTPKSEKNSEALLGGRACTLCGAGAAGTV